jgi:hypothetical protein
MKRHLSFALILSLGANLRTKQPFRELSWALHKTELLKFYLNSHQRLHLGSLVHDIMASVADQVKVMMSLFAESAKIL